jgi:hypothetical protein
MHGSFLRRWVGSIYLRQFLNYFSRFDLPGFNVVTALYERGATTRPWNGGSQKTEFAYFLPFPSRTF